MIDSVAALGLSQSLAARPTGATAEAAPIAGASFQDALKQIAADSVQTLSNAEAVSIQGLSGKAQTREVVDAVMQAEQTLQTAIAIRDKIVTAYLELSRMSI